MLFMYNSEPNKALADDMTIERPKDVFQRVHASFPAKFEHAKNRSQTQALDAELQVFRRVSQ